MFTRTEGGLSSEHLFYGVELVVYCEGEEQEGEASSLDEVFWEQVFSQNGKRVLCKSAGGKSNLRPLAQKIVNEGVGNVAVAMDRDYDDLRGLVIDHPQVLYTFGYSWESDVMMDFQFNNALSLFATTSRKKSIKEEFLKFRERQSIQLRRTFALDYKYIGSEEKLFDRRKPVSIIASPGSAEPYIKTSQLLSKAKSLGQFQTAPLPEDIYKSACGIRRFFGKSVSRLIFHWFSYRTKRIRGSRKAVYDAFMDLLASTLDLSDISIPRNAHYSYAVSRL